VSYQPPGVGRVLATRLAVGCLIPTLVVGVLALLGAGSVLTDYLDARAGRAAADAPPPTGPLAPGGEVVTITRVADGDTFTTAEAGTVRIIGVDTPETVKPGTPVQCYGPQATAHARQVLRPGRTVTLVSETRDGRPDGRASARHDRYGRRLAYVWLTDGTFWNERLVLDGYARARYYSPNDDHRADFEAAQAEAEAAGRGGWSACGW
jgi:micrococcal nuclease